MFTLFFLGISCFQLVFITYQYFLLRRIEFVYYFLYSFLITIYIAGNLLPQYNPLAFSKTNENIFTIGRGIICIGYAMYFHFGRQFTDLPKSDFKANIYLRHIANTIFIIGSIDLLLCIAGISYLQLDKVMRWIFLSIVVVSLVTIVYLFKKNDPLTKIFVIGSSLLVLGAATGLIDLLFFSKSDTTQSSLIIYLELGIIGEFLFLTFGLVYKNKIINQTNILLLKTQFQQILDERKRITTDLHDDVGAALSSMHIYGDLAISVWETQPNESKKMIDKISVTSKELIVRMGDIIWSMKTEGDERHSVEIRLKNYASELLTPKNIFCSFEIDTAITHKITLPDVRKNILLIAKEAMNNIAKYSEASKVVIKLIACNEALQFSITDNGIGFDVNKAKQGNGLQNIKERCKLLKGVCIIETANNEGTSIICDLPIAIIRHSN